jgi:mono/diheme cytochrome c family protein
VTVKAYPIIFAQLLNRGRWAGTVFVLLILLSPMSSGGVAPATSPVTEVTEGSASRGESLFTGKTHFRNRGAACVSCHSIAGVSFPNQGTVGPNLTHAYSTFGPSGIETAIQPPDVGVMSAMYGSHSLVPEERRDLLAFFKQNDTPPEAQGSAPVGTTQSASADSPVPEAPHGSAPRGESLFTGETHFRNRGPACVSCHSIAGVSFPNGGTLGPNLTHTYTTLGPRGTEAALQTLYFGVMAPIYGEHSLVPEEQADLLAFLKQSETRPETRWSTQILIVLAFLLGGIFVALTGFFWKDRVRSVRRALVDRATGQGARS